jgi:hypothetical protein
MKLKDQGDLSDLKKIEQSFKEYGSKYVGNKKCHYPKDLQALAVKVLSKGFNVDEIAKACGVTSKSVYNWRNSSSIIKKKSERPVRQLKLVCEASRSQATQIVTTKEAKSARIILTSGVSIEIPTKDLSTDLLLRLCGLEVSR